MVFRYNKHSYFGVSKTLVDDLVETGKPAFIVLANGRVKRWDHVLHLPA
jgi:hypothetical protein